MKHIALLLFALPAFAAFPEKPVDLAAAERLSPPVVQAIDDLLEPESSPKEGGEYAEVLTNGTASARIAMALALRKEGGRTNLVRAARLFGRAALEGDTDAQYWLARMYEA